MLDPIFGFFLFVALTLAFFFLWLFDTETIIVDGKEKRKRNWLAAWLPLLVVVIICILGFVYKRYYLEPQPRPQPQPQLYLDNCGNMRPFIPFRGQYRTFHYTFGHLKRRLGH
jgi:hypothetical protein